MPQPATAIIGASGALGFGLALRLGYAGIPITVGSRDDERAQETVERLKALVPSGSFSGAANGDAVSQAEIVFICVPFRNQSEMYTNLKNHLRDGQIVVDATVPLAASVSGKATRMLGVWQGSAAEQAEEMVPVGVGVVSAFHTVSAVPLGNLSQQLDQDVLICGNNKDEKAKVTAVVERVAGLRCIDCGRLEQSRIAESISALLIGINARYKSHVGIQITDLPGKNWR